MDGLRTMKAYPTKVTLRNGFTIEGTPEEIRMFFCLFTKDDMENV